MVRRSRSMAELPPQRAVEATGDIRQAPLSAPPCTATSVQRLALSINQHRGQTRVLASVSVRLGYHVMHREYIPPDCPSPVQFPC